MKIKKEDIILQAEVGSTVWGLSLTPECDCKTLEFKGVVAHFDGCASMKGSDRDEMAIGIEPIQESVGFTQFETEVFRTATERTGRADAKSEAGDLDLTVYSLRKFLSLALKGNPTVLTLLFVPQTQWTAGNAVGAHLQNLTPRIVSRQAGRAFLGYLQQQRKRMEQGNPDVHRIELAEKYGYDTKYGMHMLRLGYQGVELLSTGRMSVPLQDETRTFLLGVRQGKSDREAVLQETERLEDEIRGLLDTSPLPESPDRDGVEKWMIQTYWKWWRACHSNFLEKELGLEEGRRFTGWGDEKRPIG